MSSWRRQSCCTDLLHLHWALLHLLLENATCMTFHTSSSPIAHIFHHFFHLFAYFLLIFFSISVAFCLILPLFHLFLPIFSPKTLLFFHNFRDTFSTPYLDTIYALSIQYIYNLATFYLASLTLYCRNCVLWSMDTFHWPM